MVYTQGMQEYIAACFVWCRSDVTVSCMALHSVPVRLVLPASPELAQLVPYLSTTVKQASSR